MPLQVLNGPIIPAGQSLSAGLDCTAGTLVRITMPAGWDPKSQLTFQVSSDGVGYNDLFDGKGVEAWMKVTTGAAVRIPLEWAPIIAFLKFRSGTRRSPVIQTAQREFAVALEVPTP